MRVEKIETERLYLRPFERTDARFAIGIWNDKEMGEYLLDEAMEEISDEYLRMIEDLADDEECYYMIAENKETRERIGTCSFILTEDGTTMDIAYCVLKKLWRNGYATEMARGMVAYAEAHDVEKVTISIAKDNAGSIGVARKLGCTLKEEKLCVKRGAEEAHTVCLYELDLGIKLYETKLTDELLAVLITMSAAWEAENSSHGYHTNDRSDIEKNRIFLAERNGEVLGYLLGHDAKAERTTSVMEEGTPFFEIEELYVTPKYRSEGIGKKLFSFAEQTVQAEGLGYLMLGTATKDWKRILHFYLDELGMEFWSARLYKKLYHSGEY